MRMADACGASGVEPVLGTLHVLGESPLWCDDEQALYWVDLRAPSLHRLDPVSGSTLQWPMPSLIGGVVRSIGAGLLVALESGVFRFDPPTSSLRALIAPEDAALRHRHNDTKADRNGRLWTSTMRDYGASATGALYRIDRDLAAHRMLAAVRVPNALAWSPDDTTLYFADTSDGRLRAYDYRRETGEIGAMRVLVDAGLLPGRPDGATVDADGCIWSARYGGGCVARITPAGRIDRIVSLPVTQVTSCAFGGSDLRMLFITTARQRLDDAQLASQPLAGALFALHMRVGGLPEPRCML